jgi:ABC-type protease/lipase transport system fused ATPase/permease subunit
LEAARIAGAHEITLRLPDGYSTRIGEGGGALSSGQRQRIGLARAVFGNPFLVVLDEPDANLDAEGEQALTRTLASLRAAGRIPIVVSHRATALKALNMALVLLNGQMVLFGSREQVFEQIARSGRLPVAAMPTRPVEVSDTTEKRARVFHAAG